MASLLALAPGTPEDDRRLFHGVAQLGYLFFIFPLSGRAMQGEMPLGRRSLVGPACFHARVVGSWPGSKAFLQLSSPQASSSRAASAMTGIDVDEGLGGGHATDLRLCLRHRPRVLSLMRPCRQAAAFHGEDLEC